MCVFMRAVQGGLGDVAHVYVCSDRARPKEGGAATVERHRDVRDAAGVGSDGGEFREGVSFAGMEDVEGDGGRGEGDERDLEVDSFLGASEKQLFGPNAKWCDSW